MAGITFSEAAGLNNSIFGKSQAPIRLFVEKKAEAWEEKSIVKEIFAEHKSENFGESFTSLTAMSGFQPVGENGSHPVDEMREGYNKFLEHMTWKDSFSISREMVDDSKLMDLTGRPANFIAGYYRTKELFGAALFGGALSGNTTMNFKGKSFDVTCADGKTLFATDHPRKVKGKAQANKFSNAFSADSLAKIETAMQNFQGDNEDVLAITPNTILIPNEADLKFKVFEAIGADKNPAMATNGFNYTYGRWNVIIWPYLNQFLSGTDKPYILLDVDYSKECGGAVWLNRVDLEVNSSIDENTNANVWRGYSRFIAGFNDWRFAAVGGMTGGTTL